MDKAAQPNIDLESIAVESLDDLSESQWRTLVARRFDMVASRFDAGSERMDGMEALIDDNTRVTRATRDDTATIREIVETARSFFAGLGKFAHGCGRVWLFLRPVVQASTVLAGAYVAIRAAIWTATHGGHPPK